MKVRRSSTSNVTKLKKRQSLTVSLLNFIDMKARFGTKISESGNEGENTDLVTSRKSESMTNIRSKFKYTLSKLDKFGRSDSYETFEKLGEGTYAVVYRARSRVLNAKVAVKEIKLEHNEGAPCTALREISLLRDLVHPNIVCLHDVICKTDNLVLVFEYCPFDLKSLMKSYNSLLPRIDATIFAYQILQGVTYCHERRILHRDLKPQNILVNYKGIIKIADFGLARSFGIPSNNYSSEVVTLWYRPPDVLLGSTTYFYSVDIWSTGCIMCELFTKSPLFIGKDPHTQLKAIVKVFGQINENNLPELTTLPKKNILKQLQSMVITPDSERKLLDMLPASFIPLLKSMLTYDHKKRPTAESCLKNTAFSSLNESIARIQKEPKMSRSEACATILSSEFKSIISQSRRCGTSKV